MRKFRLFLLTSFLLGAGFSADAQKTQPPPETAEEIKFKHAAYFLCVNQMRDDPFKALQSCADYLKKYPNDDARLVEFASNFVKRFSAANEKISAYLQSMPTNSFVGDSDSWAIYKPDLERVIPEAAEKEGNYKIEIARRFDSSYEETLLNRAEAVYPNPKQTNKELYKNWAYLGQDSQIDLPKGEPKWWTGFFDEILSTETVTTSAVLYYYNLSQNFRAVKGKIKENGFAFSNTNLKYDSSIKRVERYERAGKTFSNVYVADMTLTWGQTCGGLCGHGFTRNKIVVLDEKGNVLAMFLDAPANRGSWVS